MVGMQVQVRVQVHKISLCCRVVQVGEVQVQVHLYSLCSTVVQVGGVQV